MKLNGVRIIRITDLKKFFDLDQFWSARAEFVGAVESMGEDLFFDSEDEILLYECLSPWLKEGKSPNAIVKDGRLIIRINGSDHSFSLAKRLCEKYNLATSKEILSEKDIIGLTILYILAGANAENNSMELRYDDYFASIKDSQYAVRVIGIDEDLNLEPVMVNEGDLVEWRVIFNKGEKQVKVVLDKDSYKLEYRDCIVGIFPRKDDNNSKCWKLLPNIRGNTDYKLSLRLRFNFNTMCPTMKVESKGNVSYVEDVYFIHIENGNHYVYLTRDGDLHSVEHCIQLQKAYNSYKKFTEKQEKKHKLLAIDTTSSCYKFITDKGTTFSFLVHG